MRHPQAGAGTAQRQQAGTPSAGLHILYWHDGGAGLAAAGDDATVARLCQADQSRQCGAGLFEVDLESG